MMIGMVNQVLVCNGCCCGRVEKGHVEVPIAVLKDAWNENGIADHVKLTISTCLEPCSMHKISLLETENGRTWLGKLANEEDYLAIVDWAIRVAAKGHSATLHERIEQRRFEPV